MRDSEQMAAWSESITADDFRPDAISTHQQAFNHMYQAVQIVLREDGMSGVLVMLSEVVWSMEVGDAEGDEVQLFDD